ncbi:hypothetical protein [Geobacter sp. OR-1]|uniref:hypothetical protein n=1 Tax=Geobacter sp. OR-1 TaxID=1266765 RepID=UPI00126A4EDC|nr:hypothetical protein [Geobacter sp. OR-1]
MLMNSPVHPASLYIVGQFMGLVGLDWFQAYLYLTVISLAGTAALLRLTVNLVTRELFYSTAAAVMFLASSWAQTYVHFYTYGPLSSLLMMASLYCFVKFFTGSQERRLPLCSAGFFAGLFFLSSSAAKLLSGILVSSYLVLIFRSQGKGKPVRMLLIVAAAALPVIILMPLYLKPLIEHLTTNIYAGNASLFLERYGFAPKTPFFSFFHLLRVYSPVMLIFMLVSIGATLVFWRRLKADGMAGLLLLTMMSIVIIHCVALDLLPFTKLGRAQFPLLPIAILFLTLLYSCLPVGEKIRKTAFCLFMIPLLISDTYASAQARHARRDAPARIDAMPAGTVYLVLDEDPHCQYLANWLGYGGRRLIRNIGAADLPVTMYMIPKSTPVALLLGPMGANSGKSILEHGMMDDFSYRLPEEIEAIPGRRSFSLPYYAHYPLFLMEEENCQYLYFNGKVPDEKIGRDRLTVYYWPPDNAQ